MHPSSWSDNNKLRSVVSSRKSDLCICLEDILEHVFVKKLTHFCKFPKVPKFGDQLKVEPQLHWCCVLGCTLTAWLLKQSTLRRFGDTLRDVTTQGITDGRTHPPPPSPPPTHTHTDLLSTSSESFTGHSTHHGPLYLKIWLQSSAQSPPVNRVDIPNYHKLHQEIDEINWLQSRLYHASQAGLLCSIVVGDKCYQVKLTTDR